MGWNKKSDSSSSPPAADRRAGTQPVATGKSEAAKPLALLAQRLGALEESLTVVASEIGISGVPQFKHLEPEKVYQEAVRQARDAAGQAHKDLEQRSREAMAAAGALGVRLDSELQAMSDRLDDLDTKVGALLQQLEALRRHSEDQSEDHRSEASAIVALQQRLDALEAKLARTATVGPHEDLQRRIAALEQRIAVEEPSAWPFADLAGAPSQPVQQPAAPDLAAAKRDLEAAVQQRLDQALAQLEARLTEQWQQQIDALQRGPASGAASPFAEAPPHHVSAADVDGLQESIATELAIQLARRAERNEQLPLLADRPADTNPLVINATERALVRLTHRIEKLEGQLEQEKAQARPRQNPRPARGLVGRLFES